MTDQEKTDLITKAAHLIAGGHNIRIVESIAAALEEVAYYHLGAGAKAYECWIASLEYLGNTILNIAKMERQKLKSRQ